MAHSWAPIEDIMPAEVRASRELAALASVWSEQRGRLTGQEAYREFEKRLKREWAIETGLIERIYTLERGITQLLIEHGLRAELVGPSGGSSPEEVIAMIADHKEGVESAIAFVKDGRCLSTSYIKEIHALMTRSQRYCDAMDRFGNRLRVPLLRGDYKQSPNNPKCVDGSIHEYCPPEHVAAEMDRLIAMHLAHDGLAPEIEAAWLHHRFAQIHPFQDGNGRVARTLATLVFVKASWFPLVVRDRDKPRYIDALEAADSGRLQPLADFFSVQQKREFVRALSLAEDAIKAQRVTEAIASARQKLQKRRDALIAEWETVKTVAGVLQAYALERLREVAADLQRATRDVADNTTYFADGARDGDLRSHYYRRQIIKTAQSLEYYADLQSYRAWARLVMRDENQTELLVSFHGIGHEFRGILAATATWFQRVETDDGEREIAPVTPVSDSVFQINYKEPREEVRSRFADWLEDAVVRGLTLWQETSL